MKIKFPEQTTLTLEQKTDSGYTEKRTFKKGEIVEVEGVDFENGGEWVTIVFPIKTGWLATGVWRKAFDIV